MSVAHIRSQSPTQLQARLAMVWTLATVITWVGCSRSKPLPPCVDYDLPAGKPDLLFVRFSTSGKHPYDLLKQHQYRVRGEQIKLLPPIDWKQDPFNSRSWRMYLHALYALNPLLVKLDRDPNEADMRQAADLALDWLAQNPHGGSSISEFAWYDMSVMYRSGIFSQLYRISEYNQFLTGSQRKSLGCAAQKHAHWLADNANYKYRNNHGLYQDAALLLAAKQLEGHPDGPAWRRRGVERFLDNITHTVSVEEGIHLEHSPSYHILITELARKLTRDFGVQNPQLSQLERKMTEAAPWFVMPDGRYPQLGDTDFSRPPAWVLKDSQSAHGFRVFPKSGIGIYRDTRSYLALLSWYHSRSHKHADDLSLVWAERGHRILVDAGRYGYYYKEPGRKYAESSVAHNTLTLSRPFAWRDGAAYGSGMQDWSTSKHGWYGMLAKNPLIGKHTHHQRAVVYRPGDALIVVDNVSGPSCAATTRRFHFAPTFTVAKQQGDYWELQTTTKVKGSPTTVRMVTDKTAKLSHLRGHKSPTIDGFTFRHERQWQENTTVLAQDKQCDKPMTTVLMLGRQRAPALTASKGKVTVRWPARQLSISIDANELKIDVVDNTPLAPPNTPPPTTTPMLSK